MRVGRNISAREGGWSVASLWRAVETRGVDEGLFL